MVIKISDRSLQKTLGFTIFFSLFFAAAAYAQAPNRPPADPRMDDIKRLQDNNHMIDQQQRDGAKMRSKEERTVVVNEAFKRLQQLHNEMMASIGSKDAVTKASAIAEEIKLRASELNANLALPPLENSKDKSEKSEPSETTRPTVDDHYAALCQLIRDFVKHINLSPTDPESGVLARKDLVAMIKRSDELILLVGPSSKT